MLTTHAATTIADASDAEHFEEDTVLVLQDVPWSVFEALLKCRGQASAPRYAYLEGDLEIMSPSRAHERTKTNLGRLIETYGTVRDVPVNGIGSWTLKDKLRKRGVEPDECYFVGRTDGDAPDLALEVVYSSRGLKKLPIYAGLGVSEVWIWKRGGLTIHRLEGESYVVSPRSGLLPDLDLAMLTILAPQVDQHNAVRTWMRWLQSEA